MAGSGEIRAGKAFVEISAKSSAFAKGLNAAQAKLKAFGQGLIDIGKKTAVLGAAAAAPFLAALKIFADQGDALQKMSLRTGIAVEALSTLGYAAGQSGASVEDLEKGVRKMQQNLADAGAGSATASKAFTDLGVSVAELEGLSPDEQFKLLADRISKIEDPAQRTAAAMDLFGKSGAQLLPLMNDGAAGIEALQQRAKELGLEMSGESADAAAEFGDHVADVKKQVAKAAFEVGASLAPALIDLAKRLQKVMKTVIDWVKENREMIVTAAKVAVGILAAGAAMVVAGVAIKGLAIAFGVVAGVATVFGAAVTAVGTLLAALMTPIGAVAAGVTALAVTFISTSQLAQDGLTALGEAFDTLKEDAGIAMTAIRDAISSGDFATAARVLWLTLKLEWSRGINALNVLWQTVREAFVSTWSNAITTVAKLMFEATFAMRRAWANLSAFVQTAGHKVADAADNWFTEVLKGAEELKEMVGMTTAAERNTNIQNLGIARHDREQANKKALADIENDRLTEMQGLVDGLDAAKKGLDDENARATSKRASAADASMQGTLDDLEKAKAELRETAKLAATTAAERRKTQDIDKALSDFFTPIERRGSADPPEDTKADKLLTPGTFNKFSLQSLVGSGAGDPQRRLLDVQKDNNKRLIDVVRLLGDIKLRLPVFQ